MTQSPYPAGSMPTNGRWGWYKDHLGDEQQRMSALLKHIETERWVLENWGKRRLTFEIRKQREGTYAVIECSATPATIKEFERQLGLNEQVLRFLSTRVPARKRVRSAPKQQPAPAAVEEVV